MKDTIKITVIAAGFKDANKKQVKEKPSYIPKTWKVEPEIAEAEPAPPPPQPTPNVVHQVQENVREVSREAAMDDLDVPTFLRRAQKA
jgi:hypothetical protein